MNVNAWFCLVGFCSCMSFVIHTQCDYCDIMAFSGLSENEKSADCNGKRKYTKVLSELKRNILVLVISGIVGSRTSLFRV